MLNEHSTIKAVKNSDVASGSYAFFKGSCMNLKTSKWPCFLLSIGFFAALQAQTYWITRAPTTIENELFSVASNGKTYVAVGWRGQIASSFDGIKWSTQQSGVTTALRSIACHANLFVAVGDSGTLLTSSDGINWTREAINSKKNLTVVTWGAGHFIAVGYRIIPNSYADSILDSVSLFSSPDGVTWTETKGFPYDQPSITWTGTQFYAVWGNVHTQLGTSPDGLTWTWRSIPVILSTIRWTGDKLIGCNANWAKYIASSVDGTTWTIDTIPSLYHLSLRDIAGHGDTIVAVDYSSLIFQSCDKGKTWTVWGAEAIHLSNPNHTVVGYLYAVIWAGSQFVAVGLYSYYDDGIYGGSVFTSDSGFWKSRSVYRVTYAPLFSVTCNSAQIVAVGERGTILTSPDGITWDNRTDTGVTKQSLRSVIWSGTKFLAVGDTGVVINSPDGIKWTKAPSTTTDQLKSVAWTGTQFVAVGGLLNANTQVYSNRVITSADGMTWTDRGSRGDGIWNSVIWTGSRLMAVGENDNPPSPYSTVAYTSADGLGWTSQNARTQYMGLNSVIYNGNTYIAVGGHDTYCGLTSTDGSTWSDAGVDHGRNYWSVVWGKNTFVAVGDNGKIAISTNGSSWIRYPSGTLNALYSATYTGSQYLAVGDKGTILSSGIVNAVTFKPSTPHPAPGIATFRAEYYNLKGQRLTIKNGKVLCPPNAVVIARGFDFHGNVHSVKLLPK